MGSPLEILASKIQNFIKSITEPMVFGDIEKAKKPVPTPTPKMSEIERKMRAGLESYAKTHGYGRLPIMKHVPQFVEATKYPIFRENPFLLPQMSILESSGGLNVTRANNPLNWAARIQKQGLYSPKSWEESINDAITAIAGARPPGPRFRQTLYYEPFRRTGNLKTFSDIYEPANPDYYQSLIEGIKLFERQ